MLLPPRSKLILGTIFHLIDLCLGVWQALGFFIIMGIESNTKFYNTMYYATCGIVMDGTMRAIRTQSFFFEGKKDEDEQKLGLLEFSWTKVFHVIFLGTFITLWCFPSSYYSRMLLIPYLEMVSYIKFDWFCVSALVTTALRAKLVCACKGESYFSGVLHALLAIVDVIRAFRQVTGVVAFVFYASSLKYTMLATFFYISNIQNDIRKSPWRTATSTTDKSE